jgi:hypothetical protein
MAGPVVGYTLDDGTVVRFEADPGEGFRPVGADEVLGRIREAVEPAVAGARAVLEQVKRVEPDSVELKFGVKVTGTANWVVAKAATEANFEVTLSWSPGG